LIHTQSFLDAPLLDHHKGFDSLEEADFGGGIPHPRESAMRKCYHVQLSNDERRSLQKLVRGGTASARALTHARILLKADEAQGGPSWQDEQIADALETSVPTVARTRGRFVKGGLDDALYHRPPRRTKPKKLDGHAEAHLSLYAR
jgi:Winged helix-turn helix